MDKFDEGSLRALELSTRKRDVRWPQHPLSVAAGLRRCGGLLDEMLCADQAVSIVDGAAGGASFARYTASKVA